MANENEQPEKATNAKSSTAKTSSSRGRKKTTPTDSKSAAPAEKKTSSRSRSTKKATSEKESADAPVEAAPKKTSSRSRKKTADAAPVTAEAAPAEAPAEKKKTTSSRSRKKPAQTVKDETPPSETAEVAASVSSQAAPAEAPAEKKTSSRSRSRGGRKSKDEQLVAETAASPAAEPEAIDASPVSVEAPAEKKTASRSRARGGRKSARASEPTVLEPAVTDEDGAEAVEATPAAAEAAEAAPAEAPETQKGRRRGGRSSRAQEAREEVKDAPRAKKEAAPAREAAEKPAAKPRKTPAPTATQKPMSEVAANFIKSLSSRGPAPKVDDEPVDVVAIEIPDYPTEDTPEAYIAQGNLWLERLFGALGFSTISATGSYDQENQQVVFNLSGDDAQKLLGPSGASPKILETVEKILGAYFEQAGRQTKVFVDIDNFRDRHAAKIRTLAEQIASTTAKVSNEITVAGLNDFERRIVHRHIGEGRDLTTESTGYGSFRKLRVQPTK